MGTTEAASASDRAVSATGPAVGDTIGGKYRIERIIGQGGMGRVYAAENQLTGKRVALKWVLRAEAEGARERFAREARAAGRIHHPNVVDVYDVVEDGDATCLVMELLRGQPLDGILAARGALPIVEAVAIIIEAARGIAAAHAEGVIHRDIKPANLFVIEGGAPVGLKVLDFGISKSADDPRVTRTGAIVGTPQYISPEQARGVTHIDARVDVYALGAVLFELLTGRPPFQAESVMALAVAIATQETPLPHVLRPDVPEALSAVVVRALAKSPDERHPDVASLARALEPFADGTTFDVATRDWAKGTSVPPPKRETISSAETLPAPVLLSGERPSLSRIAPQPTRSRSPFVIAALALVVVAILGGWLWTTRSASSPSSPPSAVVALPVTVEAPRVEAPRVEPRVEASAPSVEATPPPTARPTTRATARATTARAEPPLPVTPPPAPEPVTTPAEPTPPVPTTTPARTSVPHRAGDLRSDDF